MAYGVGDNSQRTRRADIFARRSERSGRVDGLWTSRVSVRLLLGAVVGIVLRMAGINLCKIAMRMPRTVYLNKPWYRAGELPVVTGIERTFWRPHKKRGGVWIWRKTGTHRSAPVFLHVESVADELDRRGISYHVNIDGREVDPAMQGYQHLPPFIRLPKGRFRRAASRAAVWNPLQQARKLLASRFDRTPSNMQHDESALEQELCLFRLEREYLRLRMGRLDRAIDLLEREHASRVEPADTGVRSTAPRMAVPF